LTKVVAVIILCDIGSVLAGWWEGRLAYKRHVHECRRFAFGWPDL